MVGGEPVLFFLSFPLRPVGRGSFDSKYAEEIEQKFLSCQRGFGLEEYRCCGGVISLFLYSPDHTANWDMLNQ